MVFFVISFNLALITFLLKGGDVGLFDATNSNIERRNYIARRCAYAGFNVLFLESICDDPVLIEKNCEMKLNSPGIFKNSFWIDYRDKSRDEALADFHMRLENYKKNYQPLDKVRDRKASYIRLFNVGFQKWSHS